MQVGFMVVGRADAMELRVFGPDRPDRPQLVSVAEEGDYRAVLMGRLYYRRELIQRLGTDGGPLESCSDAVLALAAYRKFGLDGIEGLEGDFAVAVCDGRQRRLVASRDPMGGYPLYWLQHSGTVAIGTCLRPLVDLLPGRTVNVAFLGELLMLPYAEIDYCEESAFEGVHRLVPGYSLAADPASGKVERREFWNWPERIVDPGDVSAEEAAQRYGELLRDAVRQRAQGCVAAHLSGGMDSTSVALLARDELARDGRPLHALSLVYRNLSNLDAETPYLEGALDQPGIVPHRIAADDILDFDAFPGLPPHDEPYTGLFRAAIDTSLLDAATDAGADTVMSGLGADEVLSMAPFYVADLLKRGRALRAWAEASRWAQHYNVNPWRILRPFGLMPLMPAWTHAGVGPLLHGGYAPWNRQNQYTIAPWVLPEFAHRGRLRRRAMNNIRRNYRSARSVVLSEALARIRFTTGDWVRYELATSRGIVATHPFRDPRVLSYGLGARTRVKPDPSRQKMLLAEAMRDVLPENIRNRRSKTHYNSVYFTGLARNLPHLEKIVRQSNCEELGLFDKTRLLECLNKAALGLGNMNGVIGLNNSLAIVQWLALLPRWFEEARPC